LATIRRWSASSIDSDLTISASFWVLLTLAPFAASREPSCPAATWVHAKARSREEVEGTEKLISNCRSLLAGDSLPVGSPPAGGRFEPFHRRKRRSPRVCLDYVRSEPSCGQSPGSPRRFHKPRID
jgi:hypothetical protein